VSEPDVSQPPDSKRLRLRYAARCHGCDQPLPAGTQAIYHRTSKHVECLSCAASRAVLAEGVTRIPTAENAMEATVVVTPADMMPPPAAPQQPVPERGRMVAGPPSPAEPLATPAGVAGASARREHERRAQRREQRIRQAHPHLGGLILALSDEPQSTRAWATGANGEERIGKMLDKLADRGVQTLHDRRIPGTRANIDHIAVGPAGVFVIDTKRYKGRPQLRVEGGLFRPRVEKLMVGGRDCTKLVAGMTKQTELVRAAIASTASRTIAVHGILCFIDADWPLVGGAFTISGVDVAWPKKAAQLITETGALDHDHVCEVHRVLAAAFPVA